MRTEFNSELEKTNLEVHVDMDRQRYSFLSEKVETLDENIDATRIELVEFRKDHSIKMTANHIEIQAIINTMREENVASVHGTHKLFVGAAATIIAGLLSTIVVLLVAFL